MEWGIREPNEGNDGNAGDQIGSDRNARNQGENAENRGGNAGNRGGNVESWG